MPFFRQPISTFIKSLHGRPAIIFVANEASISPLFSRPMSNVKRWKENRYRGIRSRGKNLDYVSVKMKAAPALTYNGGCRHIYAGRVVTLCGSGEIKKW